MARSNRVRSAVPGVNADDPVQANSTWTLGSVAISGSTSNRVADVTSCTTPGTSLSARQVAHPVATGRAGTTAHR